jgi:cytochrome b subunit of formate dehydrogenase
VTSAARHPRWVRIAHALAAVSVLTLAFTGFMILMVHPRLYWGDAGNDLTRPLVELPISRNYKHGGWDEGIAFFQSSSGPTSASRTYDIFNQNGWGRSLHFLAAWGFLFTGIVYVAIGISRGHFRAHMWPAARGHYGLLQRSTYAAVVFAAAPLIVATGLTMSPAVTAAVPALLRLFGGYQSARTIHFFSFVALALFVIGHIVMVVRSGFTRQVRAITVGE